MRNSLQENFDCKIRLYKVNIGMNKLRVFFVETSPVFTWLAPLELFITSFLNWMEPSRIIWLRRRDRNFEKWFATREGLDALNSRYKNCVELSWDFFNIQDFTQNDSFRIMWRIVFQFFVKDYFAN